MLINLYQGIILINFIKGRVMFGMCQNVEIIHEHHHHFYQVVLPPHTKNSSTLSKTFSQAPQHAQISPNSPKKADTLHETHTSRFYHSKRSYFGKNQKGIEVVSCKDLESFQYQNITLLKNQNQHLNQRPIQYHLHSLSKIPSNIPNNISTLKFDSRPHLQQYHPNLQKEPKHMSYSIEKSIPSIEINYASKNESVKTKQNYFNCHKLKQSKMGFNSQSIYDTKKKTWKFNNTETNITLSIPMNSNKNKLLKPNSEIMKKTQSDKDSIVTKKQNKFLSAFRTENMFDDAKSIISRQSLDKSQINIEQSIIISRSMDYFCHLTAQMQLDCCKMYLAVDKKINWIVTIRLFECKNEHASLRQAQLFNRIGISNQRNGVNYPVLNLYKILVEGDGLYKNIYFVLEPYQCVLDQYINSKKDYFNTIASSFNYFISDLENQLFSGLSQLQKERVVLTESLSIKDIVIVNGRYKFHSVSKFFILPEGRIIFREATKRYIQNLKGQIFQVLKGF